MDEWTAGRPDERTDRRTDGRTACSLYVLHPRLRFASLRRALPPVFEFQGQGLLVTRRSLRTVQRETLA